MEIALVGNPNCGKTTLFNLLTGSNQRVGNWAGVTVECKSGLLTLGATTATVVDLPGIYTLTVASQSQSIDERVACEYILATPPDCIVNIVDASQLERSLYLTSQLQDANIPMIIAVNMLDVAERENIQIDIEKLARQLDCPVIGLTAAKKQGVAALKQCLTMPPQTPPERLLVHTDKLNTLIAQLSVHFKHLPNPYWHALHCIEGDVLTLHLLNDESHAACHELINQYLAIENEAADISLARARFDDIKSMLSQCMIRPIVSKKRLADRVDQWLLNRFLGLPIFLIVMYAMFIFAINLGGILQDCFDQMSQLLFVDSLAYGLQQLHFPVWITGVIATGIGKGLATTVAFIPVIGAMFFALAFLESCGYMARAAFVMDRVMRALGLPGKSFVPMIIGFGCNVPAVLAARTLESRRDRILTIMMSPFMSCGARLAIYAVFVAAFFPSGGQNIVFLLYLIGIIMAVLTGLMLRKTVLTGDASPLIMELPEYHMPSLKTLFYTTWFRLRAFLKRAVKVIVPLCLLLGCLNGITIDGKLSLNDADQHSILSSVGRLATPLVAPMGIQESNWPATVGLATGMIAKEVVVGTLNTLYNAQVANVSVNEFDFWTDAKAAMLTVPEKIKRLPTTLLNPISASAPKAEVADGVYGQMSLQFGSQAAAFAYLLFLLLYFPCVSTTAVMIKELNRSWAAFSVGWTTGLAYFTSVCFYQIVTVKQHPVATGMWLLVFVGFVIAVIQFLRHQGLPPAATTPSSGACAPSGCAQCA